MDCYDPDSGQIYRETIVRQRTITREERRPWEHASVGRKPRDILSPCGADSLKAMAMRKIVCYAETLLPETLEVVPTHLAMQISKAIRRCGMESLHIWKLFARSGHGDRTFVHRASLNCFRKPMVDHLLDVTSTNFAWLTDLTLSDVYCSPAELKQVAVLDNIQNLQVSYSRRSQAAPEPFDDDVLGHLATRAANDCRLSRLQMIFITNASRISESAFQFLSHFIALDTFCACGTSIKVRHVGMSKHYGWVRKLNSSLIQFANNDKSRARYGVGVESITLDSLAKKHIDRRRSEMPREICDLPVLDTTFDGQRNGKPFGRFEDTNMIMCFERDWGFIDPNIGKNISMRSSMSTVDPTPSEPAIKIRKLRRGKAITIDSILNSL